MLKIGIQILFEVLLFILLFFNVFVFRTFNLEWTILGIVCFLILLFFFIRFKKPIKKRDKTHYYIIIGGCLLTLGIFYLCGLFSGFSQSYNVFYKNYLTKSHILFVFIIIILIELIRYLSLSNLKHNKKDSKYYLARTIMVLNYLLIDYIILGSNCNFKSKYEVVNLLLTFVIPTITKHLLLDYTSLKYGYVTNYWYRLLMDLYTFFIPIIPNVNIFIETVILTVLPYFIYITLENVLGKTKKEIRIDKKKSIKINIIALIILTILVYLISCQFTYSMIAVGSESMQGTIDKGDAVIYKAYQGEKLDIGEIIVFQQNNKIMVHRIASIIEVENDEQAYITKGDANESEDNWIVTKENTIGVVKLRVLLIAWPSVILNEWL